VAGGGSGGVTATVGFARSRDLDFAVLDDDFLTDFWVLVVVVMTD